MPVIPSKPPGVATWNATVVCPLLKIFRSPFCSVKNSLPSGANCKDHGTVNPPTTVSVVTITGFGVGVGAGAGAGEGEGVGMVVVVLDVPAPHAIIVIVSEMTAKIVAMRVDDRKECACVGPIFSPEAFELLLVKDARASSGFFC